MRSRFFLFLAICSFNVKSQIVTTIAGNGIIGCNGNGASATSAKISDPMGSAFDKNGIFYFANQQCHTVCKIDHLGILSVIAGTGMIGFSGDNGPATAAKLFYPNDVAIDTMGHIYILDGMNYRVRKIDINTGVISTVVGTGTSGYSGDGGPATSASISTCNGLCFDRNNNMYISDAGNHRIRKINATNGVIATIAGTGVPGFSGDAGPATAAQIFTPFDLAVDKYGSIYFPDANNKRIRKVTASGIIETIAGNGDLGVKSDNIDATLAYIRPYKIALNQLGDIYFSDSNKIRKISTTRFLTTVAGTGTSGYNGDTISATSALVSSPSGLAVDTCGNVYFGDVGNARIRKIAFNPDCVPMTVKDDVTDKTNGVTLLPNPTTGMVTIMTVAPVHTVAIYNLLGQVVLQQAGCGKPQQQVDLSTLPPGVYIVQVNDVWTARLVKE